MLQHKVFTTGKEKNKGPLFKVVKHIEMPKAAPKSPFVIFKN